MQEGVNNTKNFTYNDASKVLTESYTGGALDGLSITNGYDQFLRRTNLAALQSSNPFIQQSNSFDSASRYLTFGDGQGNTATYSYLANSALISQIVFKQGATTRMTTAKDYDKINRLSSISSVPSGSPPVSFSYQYNNANQRIQGRLADGSLWVYEYDSLGQLTSAKHFWPDWTPVAGQRFGYAFDDIGNRTSTLAGGDETGASLRSANYSANRLNQYTSRDVPGAVDVMGLALATESVTVNGQSAYQERRQVLYQRANIRNSISPEWNWLPAKAMTTIGAGDRMSRSQAYCGLFEELPRFST